MPVERGDLPEAVRGPDGRTEPFEPERIARSLFAATERIGQPDAFLARELTDGVLHFLTADTVGSVTTPDQISDTVIKVVRELGQPTLAAAYEALSSPTGGQPGRPVRPAPASPQWLRTADSHTSVARAAAGDSLTSFSLSHLFPRDLVSAHQEGLIRMAGLTTPLELAGVAAEIPPGGVLAAMRRVRETAGEFVTVDGPEFDLAATPGDPAQLAAAFLRETGDAAETLGLSLVVNLNIQSLPTRLAEGAGPLFQDQPRTDRHTEIAREIAVRAPDGPCRVWWHVTADATEQDASFLQQLNGVKTEFVFDRGRGPVILGPGIDRQAPAALMVVGVNLARLVEMSGGAPVDARVFLRKVASLARFAKTAGHVKQDFLRRHGRPGVREAFLLDRACLVLVPMGLDVAAQASDVPAAEFACTILKTLRTAVEKDRPRVLPVRIDSPLDDGNWTEAEDSGLSIRQQVRQASQWHAVTSTGRLDLVTRAGAGDRLAALRAAAESSVARLRFRPSPSSSRQPQ